MSPNVLITTPDYPPQKIGGISTFVLNLEKALKNLNVNYELFVWSSAKDCLQIQSTQYELIINAHFHAQLFINHPRMITYIHGGELLPFSKNPFKHLIKRIGHKRILSVLHKSLMNIFVSNYSFNLYKQLYGEIDYSKNMVLHNCIDLELNQFIEKDLHGEIHLCSFVRDVPHKNIKGCVELYKKLKNQHPNRVTLTISAKINTNDPDIICIPNADDQKREEVLKRSHFNLLLSLDHSRIGNIEGFGLTVLEAGKYGVPTLGLSTGGLPESIHHMVTGVLVDQLDNLYEELFQSYNRLNINVYNHTMESHGIDQLQKQLLLITRSKND